jgi:hypothetical protein
MLERMRRVLVHLRDDRGRESVVTSDEMSQEKAEAERGRIEKEHAEAGDTNRWIRVGGSSVQSKHIFSIEVNEPPSSAIWSPDVDDEPAFRRDMDF